MVYIIFQTTKIGNYALILKVFKIKYNSFFFFHIEIQQNTKYTSSA